jgi:uncharacterized protein YcgI (DUF1989 family)
MSAEKWKSSPQPHMGLWPLSTYSEPSTTPVERIGGGSHSTLSPFCSTESPSSAIGRLLVMRVDPMNVLVAVACVSMAYSLLWGF